MRAAPWIVAATSAAIALVCWQHAERAWSRWIDAEYRVLTEGANQ